MKYDYISYKIKSTKRDSVDIAIKIETYETTCTICIFERDKCAKILGLILILYGIIRKTVHK